jgi:hypothetical protein
VGSFVPSISQDKQHKLPLDLLLWAGNPSVAVAAARAGLLASAASAAERAGGVPGNEGERLVRAALLVSHTHRRHLAWLGANLQHDCAAWCLAHPAPPAACRAAWPPQVQAAVSAVASGAAIAAADLQRAGGTAGHGGGHAELAEQLREGAARLSASVDALHPSGKALAAQRSAGGAQELAAALKPLLQPAADLAALVHQHWQLPEQATAVQVERTQAAATRSCAYAGCANLGAGGGSKLCSGCRVARYCGVECSHADWRQGGHRRVCKALAAARQPQQGKEEARLADQ